MGNDGEQPRVGFSTYVARRMRGFGGESRRPPARDLVDFPDYAALLEFRRRAAAKIANAPQALAEVEYVDLGEAARECDLLLEATAAPPKTFVERFMTAASPGIIATTLLNAHYDSHERYVFALAREMQKEYELIHSRGLLLQLDCPDLAMERTRLFQHEPLERFLQIVEAHVEDPRGRHRVARLLGQLRRPAPLRRPPGGDPAPRLSGAGRGALARAGESPPRARVQGAPAAPLARRDAVPARGDRLDHELRRASRSRGRPDRSGRRRGGRPEPCDRVRGLWIRDLRRLGARGRERGLGEAPRAQGRRRPRERHTLGPVGGKAGRHRFSSPSPRARGPTRAGRRSPPCG